MMHKPYQVMSEDAFAMAHAKAGHLPLDAVDGGLIVLVDPLDQRRSSVIGVFWLVLDPANSRIGYMHSAIDSHEHQAHAYAARATDVENYASDLLVATRRLDLVHLVRQGRVVDYTEKGRQFDEKMALVIASIQARNLG